MAEHPIVIRAFYGGDWHDLPVYVRDGISASRGAGGEGQESPPSKLALSIDNSTRDYSPGNLASPLSGLIGRNMPVQLVVDGTTRTTVEASSLQPDQEYGTDPVAWVELDGGGIMRRLQNGKTPLRSALHRAILAADVTPAYWWDLEGGDGRATTGAASTLSGGPALQAAPASAGSTDHRESGAVGGAIVGPPGGGGAIDLSGGGQLSAFLSGMSADGPARFEVSFLFTEPVDVAASGQIIRIDTGTSLIGVFAQETAGAELVIELSDDGSFFSDTAPVVVDDGVWHRLRLDVEPSSGSIDYTLSIDGAVVFSGLAATWDRALELVLSPTGDLDAAAQLVVWDGAVPVSVDTFEAHRGYAGELAGHRFGRILGEQGITAVVVGDPDDTQPCGAQPADTLMNIVRETVRTDDGMLFEPADQVALVMRTGRSRYNQDPVSSFSWASPGIARPFRPKYDDRPTANDVTVERRGGGIARAVQLSGPMNINDPADDPDGVGLSDVKVDVNTETVDVLPIHAGWHLSKGTVPDARYPAVTFDLDDAPELIPDIDALDIGDRFEITDLPADWSIYPVSMLLVGIQEVLPSGAGQHRRLVTLVGVPAAPFEVLQVGDGTIDLRGMRVHTHSSTVDGDHLAADTSILMDSAGIEWTTNPDNWNPALNGGGMFLDIGPERVRVTGIAGAGSAWTLTVERAVNGITGDIPDGTPVRFAYLGRIAL